MIKWDISRITKCDIGISTLSDHNLVYVSLDLDGRSKSTLWKINTNILNNRGIRDKLNVEIDFSYVK